MKTSSAIHSLVCFFLLLFILGKGLAEPAIEKETMVVTTEWLTQKIAENLRESYQHLEGDMQVALARTKPNIELPKGCLLYTSPNPRDRQKSRMPSSA